MMLVTLLSLVGCLGFIIEAAPHNTGVGDIVPNRVNPEELDVEGDQCAGLDCAEYRAAAARIDDIRRFIDVRRGRKYVARTYPTNRIGDIAFTLEQANEYFSELGSTKRGGRQKRKVWNYNLWTSPVYYHIDPNYFTSGSDAYSNIMTAIQHWNDNTCLDFVAGTPSDDRYLFITSDGGCYSYIGKNGNSGAQTLSLGSGCAVQYGTPIHEIGHALGMFHEQSRLDRDSYVTIDFDNIQSGREGNFALVTEAYTNDYDVPYDHGSVMHYGPTAFCQDCTANTIVATDVNYQNALGNRGWSSHWDRVIINKHYSCPDTCSGTVCANGGTPNSRDCSTCLCPEGLGGDLCDEAGPMSDGCSPDDGNIAVTSTTEQCLHSPNWDISGGKYNNGDRCSWLLTAPEGNTIDYQFDASKYYLTFSRGYGGNALDDRCAHWVEIKDQDDKSLRAPRYCSDTVPDFGGFKTSGSNTVVVSFDAFYKDSWSTPPTASGFQLCYKLTNEPSTECAGHDCQNDGVCVPGSGTFTCDCTGTGFTGDKCQTNIDDCSGHDCQNGGSCVDGINTFTCECSGTGFSGDKCQTNIDDCSGHDCGNGGACVDGIDTFTCDCSGTGFSGDKCQTNIDDCSGHDCQNGGVCVDGINTFTCDCTGTDFVGDKCGDGDDCVGHDCENGGSCLDGDNTFTCECSGTGFTGDKCQTANTECDGHDCENSGTCVGGTDTFTCDCSGTDYVGDKCEILNPCLIDPCLNGGVCGIRRDYRYKCNCADTGYRGRRCQRDINECRRLELPCNGHGRCRNEPGGYRCNCRQRWTGEFCETRV